MRLLHHQPCLLLVGEGNFSFSASLCEARSCDAHIVATCYESEATATRQAVAKSNIQYLRDRGAKVLFCVDCTKLKEHFLPADWKFDCIYFNFPHCGRKAGVKKNRELLARFFFSCAEVLAEKGEVHVALCRGQGGTPADQPVREWHNSWQVVAMAAEAGFILSDIHPFNIGDACRYKCTGYRGFLDTNSEHPIRTINEKLTDELGKSFPVQKVSASLSLMFQDCHSSSSTLDATWMVPAAQSNPKAKSVVNKTAADTEAFAFPSGFPAWDDTDLGGSLISWERDWIFGHYCLRPSLLVSLHRTVRDRELPLGTFLVLSGLAFRKCKLSAHALPIFHESVFICVVNKGTEEACSQLLAENLTSTLCALLQPSGFKLDCTADKPKTQRNTFANPELQLLKSKYFFSVTPDTSDPDPNKLCVGTLSTTPWQPTSIDREIVCASLNLDLLAMHVCEIFDWRMLWTSDERFLNQFAGGHLGPFKSFSLYPVSYVHDVSFWVPKPEKFNETQLHAIARCVSSESVVSIQLLDSFRHPGTGQTSLCYRITYQSCDKALSRQQVATMQMNLRKEIQRCLHVTLR
ncbi:ferredoxin-fold anticodon-binding domain-containing protein 1 isoform X2 [Podarcis raffonei]|uniref:ferredoxin-fold anticodon-binding domain-containing protein 1 isoform X2 n=1 Tax=Podarcis raffonei TaxID=65483 RepID=UPI0023294FE8|nr:ferredoxin-fold anticodon-binding domain-containing protein 1 isoform X2 [Podarcis raffonei]